MRTIENVKNNNSFQGYNQQILSETIFIAHIVTSGGEKNQGWRRKNSYAGADPSGEKGDIPSPTT